MFFKPLQKKETKRIYGMFHIWVVVEFFYEVYKNYNVQFWGMIGSSDALEDSSENAMTKMAIDIVHRLVLLIKMKAIQQSLLIA